MRAAWPLVAGAFMIVAVAVGAAGSAAESADEPQEARAALVDTEGMAVDEVGFVALGDGRTLVRAEVERLPAGGFHGVHVHERGSCEDGFAAAGGHLSGDEAPHGEHAGDLPVLGADDDGRGRSEWSPTGSPSMPCSLATVRR